MAGESNERDDLHSSIIPGEQGRGGRKLRPPRHHQVFQRFAIRFHRAWRNYGRFGPERPNQADKAMDIIIDKTQFNVYYLLVLQLLI